MNNRELYIDVMSGIQPSENVIERIMDMTDSKRKFKPKKGLIAVLVVIAILAFGGITANAATDGAVAEYISNTLTALVTTGENGEKLVTIDGEVQGAGEIVLKDENGTTEGVLHYDIQSDDDTVKAFVTTDENGEKCAVIVGDMQDGAGEMVVVDEETGEEEIAQYQTAPEDDSVE